jgi:hypothetical protein
MAVGEGGSDSNGEGTAYLVAKAMADLKSLSGDIFLDIIAGAKGYKVTKREALLYRTRNLIEQNHPKKGKESE